jgi:hypothetical protein
MVSSSQPVYPIPARREVGADRSRNIPRKFPANAFPTRGGERDKALNKKPLSWREWAGLEFVELQILREWLKHLYRR